ncbi:hypothetical protein G4H71_15660 [Rhodococcus triatomae]|nr:hypothetical protein [Rhodococcus triatomae]QNG19803.1 hypothetical protein G4H72_14710 [Rhodococcus triatomae]QNG24281.1 hypothetical protein G4H71_15660 [Rhodococcus triatomae]
MPLERRRGTTTGFLACALTLVVAAGCATEEVGDPSPESPTLTTAPPTPPPEQGGAPGHPLAGFDEVVAAFDGSTGLAIAPVGGGQSLVAGDVQTGPAWATIDVAVSLARERGEPDPTDPRVVEEVLREYGDPATVVGAPLEQTEWSLPAQAQFASFVPCDERSGPALAGPETPEWGLGAVEGAQFSSGTGTDPGAGYSIRQFGVVPSGTGQLAVALAVTSASDAATARDQATRLAEWIAARAAAMGLPPGC